MDGVSFSATTEKRKGILFDPRTKLVLLLTITTLMFSTSNEGIMNIVKPCLSLVPFVLILSEHRFKTAGKYLLDEPYRLYFESSGRFSSDCSN